MRQQAKGWTHPSHWKVATIGTLCQILAVVFIALGLFIPFFTDRRPKSPLENKIINLDIRCDVNYCYNSKDKVSSPSPKSAPTPESGWLDAARILLAVGACSNALSLVLLLLIFWPCVLFGKVLNAVLFICRIIDFFGAPTKFIGAFFFIWYIPDINHSYSWWKYDGLLMMDPLPIGMVLFSYILQTLCFVCATLAIDRGAKGQPTHIELFKQLNLMDSLEAAEPEEFQRVSYHPLQDARSSKLLSEVKEHFGEQRTVTGTESIV